MFCFLFCFFLSLADIVSTFSAFSEERAVKPARPCAEAAEKSQELLTSAKVTHISERT